MGAAINDDVVVSDIQVLQHSDLPAGLFLRNEIASNAKTKDRPSELIPGSELEQYASYERRISDIPDFLVRLKDVQVRGDKSLVFTRDNLFSHSTTSRDWEASVDLSMPSSALTLASPTKFLGSRRYANYYHWTFQCLSVLLDIKSQGMELSNLLVPPLNGWRRESLELIGADLENCYELSKDDNVKCQELIFSVYSSTAFTYALPARFTNLFEDFARSITSNSDVEYPEKIYLSREGSSKRCIENEAEIAALARKYGFCEIRAEEMSVLEQICYFASARHVLAPHGAGLANLLYCVDCVSVSEIFQAHYINPCMYQICNAKGIKHFTLSSAITHEGGRHHSKSKMDLGILDSHLSTIV